MLPPRTRWAAAAAASLALGVSAQARGQEPELSWAGKIQSDIRFRIEDKRIGAYYDRLELPAGVARNENRAGLKLHAAMGDVSGVADVELVLLGHAQDPEGLSGLADRNEIDPYRFDIHELYLQVQDLIIDGLDLRVGQQLVLWGVGDQFNPTNNINADDLEDPLMFGEQLGNVMVRMDYWINEDWSLTGVLVPIFKPALLSRSAQLGVAAIDRLPMQDAFLRHRIHSEQASSAGALIGHPTVVAQADPELPETSINNMQIAYRIGGTIAEHDIALSYYRGRWDLPVARRNHTVQSSRVVCNPDRPSECTKGLLETAVTMHYPQMSVYGLNVTGEIGWLQDLSDAFQAVGYRLEGALVVPTRSTLTITNDQLDIAFPQPAGEYDYDDDGRPGGPEPIIIDDTPFLKWVLGLDYTFSEHVYANLQWVHGMVDEYGAGDWLNEGWAVRQGGVTTDDTITTLQCAIPRDGTRCAREVLKPTQGDYLVAVADVNILEQSALIRLTTILYLNGIWEDYWSEAARRRVREHHDLFSAKGFSAVVYPEFGYNFRNGLELGTGALILLGNDYSKFGDPAAGGSLVWTRARYSF